MRAIRVHEYGGPEAMRLEEVPTPKPGEGQALVRLEAGGVNFIDVYQRSGLYKGPLPLPLGLEGAGVVEATGPGVTTVRAGDHVAWTGVPGSYATHNVVPADRLVTLPAGMDSRTGAAAMLQGMTAHYLAHSTYPLKPGDACLVHAAAGGVGLLLCQMAKRAGARVLGTVSTEDKAKLAREAGARRRHLLHAPGPRDGGEAADRRKEAPGGLRLGRPGHVREGPQLPRGARVHGAVTGSRAGRWARSIHRC